MQDLKEPLHQGLRGAVHPVKGLVNPSWHLRGHELPRLLGVSLAEAAEIVSGANAGASQKAFSSQFPPCAAM